MHHHGDTSAASLLMSAHTLVVYDVCLLETERRSCCLIHTHSQMALLVMDVQAGIVTRFAQTGDFLKRINTAIAAARAALIPVIYVVVTFRQGYPEISPRNKSFSAVKQQQSSSQAAMTATEIHPAIAPQPADIVVTKRRVSAFSGSDLEVVLRAQGIAHLAILKLSKAGIQGAAAPWRGVGQGSLGGFHSPPFPFSLSVN